MKNKIRKQYEMPRDMWEEITKLVEPFLEPKPTPLPAEVRIKVDTLWAQLGEELGFFFQTAVPVMPKGPSDHSYEGMKDFTAIDARAMEEVAQAVMDGDVLGSIDREIKLWECLETLAAAGLAAADLCDKLPCPPEFQEEKQRAIDMAKKALTELTLLKIGKNEEE